MRKTWSKIAAVLSAAVLAAGFSPISVEAAPEDVQKGAESVARQWIVSQDGRGDFVTISQAVEAAADGDTIWICPGVYEESVQMPEKELHLVGVDKKTCIIQNCKEDYFSPPLEAAAGTVQNLTIYAYRVSDDPIGKESTSVHEREPQGSINDVSEIYAGAVPLSSFAGYAVHIESDYSAGRSLIFDNCIIRSDCNYAVGAGLRGESELIFQNCELIGKGSAGNIYMHDSASDLTGNTRVAFLGTRFVCDMAPYFLSIFSRNEENRVELLFQGVTIDGVAYQNKEIYSVSNLYNGLTADELPENRLEKLNLQRTQDYLKAARSFENPLKAAEVKSGKIAYLRDNSMLNTMTWEEALRYEYRENPAYANRKRTYINVWNIDGLERNGWGGSMSFYLSPESGGNSLPDLNYTDWITKIAPVNATFIEADPPAECSLPVESGLTVPVTE